jgi:hypothetical protein
MTNEPPSIRFDTVDEYTEELRPSSLNICGLCSALVWNVDKHTEYHSIHDFGFEPLSEVADVQVRHSRL